MNLDKIKETYGSHEIRIDNHGNYSRKPPYYYDSLRHAFQYYFNTFNTQNWLYESYANAPFRPNDEGYGRQYLDEENTILSIVSFQRFFELFLKDLLYRVDPRLTVHSKNRKEFKGLESLIELIQKEKYVEEDYSPAQSINFQNTINRFFGLTHLLKARRLSESFENRCIFLQDSFDFLATDVIQSSMSILNWYRDRLLHKGNKIPSMLLLDYLVTQQYAPLISQIIEIEKSELGESTFFLTTTTAINILDRFTAIKFDLNDYSDTGKREELFISLLHIGHLKEMGRANLNMDLYSRDNIQACYEYNYRNPKGRGVRFAEVETAHPNFKDIKKCPCCGTKSLVLYIEIIEDIIFNPCKKKNIEWMKCYSCDYHLRHNVGDPHLFGLSKNSIFTPS